MSGAILGSDAVDMSNFFGLSRPVQTDETIDFFMSSSWHDDKDAKWEKLVQVAADFYKDYGRYPTFWLDKVCIDQTRISDCLQENVGPLWSHLYRTSLVRVGIVHSFLFCPG